jgi:outer membrane protein OmpA-like peptidoglycan-associated protein
MRAVAWLAVLALGGAALAAQDAGTGEVGAFAGWLAPGVSGAGDGGPGGGARIALRATGRLGIEVEAAGFAPGSGVTTTLLAATASWRFRATPWAPYARAGYARVAFSGAAGGDAADDAVLLALGDGVRLGARVVLRLELGALLAPSTSLPGGGAAMHWLFTGGLAFFPGAGASSDADFDGIADATDRCPGTLAGAVVAEDGCARDSDNDGVANGLDLCPNTPPAAVIGGDGCPLDEDGDLVYDGIDQCPGTPRGAQVHAQGCPSDADRDGVFDGLDRCPNTAAGARVDAIGCPTDADGDRVPDGVDRCPGTPPGTTVGDDGCPPPAAVAPPPQVAPVEVPELFTTDRSWVELRGVNFATGESRLLRESFPILNGVAAALLEHPEWRIEVAGYTDSTGSVGRNIRLSQARAAAVRAYLASKGVPPERLVARGYGPASPLAPNNTAAGRARNRRVELHLLNPP